MTRVLVVGAGSNGLVAAATLVRAGLDVEVLEHGPRVGGAASSSALTLPGFVHDDHAGFVPMAVVSPAIRELEPDVEWVDPPTVMAHPFDDGTAMVLDRDLEATVVSLGAAGPPWRALIERTAPHAERLARAVLGRLPPVRDIARLALALRRDGLDLARLMLGSSEAFGHSLFAGDPRATAWLAGSGQHTGLPPSTTGSGAFSFMLQLLGHTHGWPFPRGGMQKLADALADGTRVRCGAHVERILVRRGRVCGVRLAGGEEIAADAVITTISARPLAAMLPDEAMPDRLIRRLHAWRYGTAAFKLDYALRGPVPWTAPAARHAAVVHVAGELGDLAGAAIAAQRGEVPERPALVVGQQSLHDPTRAPAGHHTLYVYGHVPSRAGLPDEAIAERIEDQLERFAPGFRGLVEARSVRGPERVERENPSLVGGDLAGGAYELDQLLVFRPAPELCRGRTPLRGLYVAGASVHPGGAVHGMSGRAAARGLLTDSKLRRL